MDGNNQYRKVFFHNLNLRRIYKLSITISEEFHECKAFLKTGLNNFATSTEELSSRILCMRFAVSLLLSFQDTLTKKIISWVNGRPFSTSLFRETVRKQMVASRYESSCSYY